MPGLAPGIQALLMWTAPHGLVGLFVADTPENARVIGLAVAFLGLAALFQVFDGVQAIAIGALRGLKDTRMPAILAAIGYWLVGFPVGIALAFHAGWGGVGVWCGLALGLAVVAVLELALRPSRDARPRRARLTRPHPCRQCGMAGSRQRLDLALVARGLADSRARAQALIKAGAVYSGSRRLDKASVEVAPDQPLDVRGQDHPWVSRGGVKLAHALDRFGIDPAGLTVLDIGASTGGFTDVVLSRGAAKVYAVDSGHGQLAEKLRADPRVIVLEKTNARHLTPDRIPDPVDLVVCDASFIGLETVLPAPLALARPGAALVALIKPQFEVGPGHVGKGGIVRDAGLHDEVCARIAAWLTAHAWYVLGVVESPIAGADGNREFLIAARLNL